MTIIAYGINHETAPVAVREKVGFTSEMVFSALADLKKQSGVHESAILSTCNRTEIYCNLDQENNNSPIDWLYHFHGISAGVLQPFLYKYPGATAVRHLLRVASGLDSMVLGEPQVLGQLKDAYNNAINAGNIGHQLNRLFQYSFHVAKRVRSNTAIGNHPISIAFAAVRLAQQIFGTLHDQSALLIGAGETIELVIKHLHEHGLRRIVVANRTLAHSQRLASKYSVYAIKIADIPQHIVEADIIISATASPLNIIEKHTVEYAINRRKHKPILMVDIAVPRDIAVEVGNLDDVYLYSIDDLNGIIQGSLQHRQQAAIQAEKIIDLQAQEFMAWLESCNTVPTIKALITHSEQIQQAVLARSVNRLKSGADPELILRETVNILTKKLMHSPISQLKNVDRQDQAQLLAAVEKLHGLNKNSK